MQQWPSKVLYNLAIILKLSDFDHSTTNLKNQTFFGTHLSFSSLLALITARDQFETFVTIIRSLRLTFTFLCKIPIFLWTTFFWFFHFFFVAWIKPLLSQSNSYQSSSWKLQANLHLPDDKHSFYAWNPLGLGPFLPPWYATTCRR